MHRHTCWQAHGTAQSMVQTASTVQLKDISQSFTPQELLRKRRFGRLQKVMGDYSLLAGSPGDAIEKYQAAADLARASSDFIWAGASLEGLAHARVSKKYSAAE